jgi:hypothetical protein
MRLPGPEEGNSSLSFDAVEFKKKVLPLSLAKDAGIQKVLEEFSADFPDAVRYTWQKDGEKMLYPGLSEEKCLEITEYITKKLLK